MIDIIEDEPLINHISKYDAIVVGTNCYQVMRNGFQFEIARKYPYVKLENYNTKYGDIDKLGTILECKKENMPTIILSFISFGYNFKGDNKPYIDYNALEKTFKLLNLLYEGKHLATTMIGTTTYDGNADQSKVLEILNKTVTNFDLSIFDYNQESYNKQQKKEYRKKLQEKFLKLVKK
jgi:hypothetical protein